MGEVRNHVDVKKIISDLAQSRPLKRSNIKPLQRPDVVDEGNKDVSEAYSPPRVTAMADRLGMKLGTAFDLTRDLSIGTCQ